MASGDPQAEIEPEHLLLGIAQENGGVAAQILRDPQADPRDVQAKMTAVLG